MNKLIMVGIEYMKSSLEIREKTAFSKSKLDKAYDIINKTEFIEEVIILSTCNRSEIYVIAQDEKRAERYMGEFYSSFFQLPFSTIEKNIIIRKGSEAITHLFDVAAGLKSMVLGEDQILNQVKTAYETAHEKKMSGKFLNRLFLDSVCASKRVRTLTKISRKPVSVASVGVRLIEKEIGCLKNRDILVIGLGEISQLTIKYLLNKETGNIYVANRTKKVVESFANEHANVKAVNFDDRYDYIRKVNVIISCTGAPHYVLHYDEFVKKYKGNKLILLDLALPRDIEPEIEKLESIKLHIIDDLKETVQENMEMRMKEVKLGEEIVAEQVLKYIEWTNKH